MNKRTAARLPFRFTPAFPCWSVYEGIVLDPLEWQRTDTIRFAQCRWQFHNKLAAFRRWRELVERGAAPA